jgi:hypothetical protein
VEFDKEFTETKRNYANVRPGLRLYRDWPLAEAIELDETPALCEEVKDAYARGLKALTG